MKYADLAVLGQLMKAGADLRRPRHARYYSYFPSRDSATAAGEHARQRGFVCDVREPLSQHPDQWALICELDGVVLDFETVRANDDFLVSLAQEHCGDYDGWEASV